MNQKIRSGSGLFFCLETLPNRFNSILIKKELLGSFFKEIQQNQSYFYNLSKKISLFTKQIENNISHLNN